MNNILYGLLAVVIVFCGGLMLVAKRATRLQMEAQQAAEQQRLRDRLKRQTEREERKAAMIANSPPARTPAPKRPRYDEMQEASPTPMSDAILVSAMYDHTGRQPD